MYWEGLPKGNPYIKPQRPHFARQVSSGSGWHMLRDKPEPVLWKCFFNEKKKKNGMFPNGRVRLLLMVLFWLKFRLFSVFLY